MGDASTVSDESLSQAVVAYLGVPGRLDGVDPEERVLKALGDSGLDLLPAVKAIVDEVYEAEPPLWAADSLEEIGRRVETWLRENHPELTDEAVQALTNRFAFDWK